MDTDAIQKLVIETATNVKWIKESMQDQHKINLALTKQINGVKARVWTITGVIIGIQAVIGFLLEFHR